MNQEEEIAKALEKIDFDQHHPKPLIIVISGPSGVGKDAVVQTVTKRDPKLAFVVTYTSRKPRPEERDGVDYNFISEEEFIRRIENGEFLEHAWVYDHYKGVLCEPFEKAFAMGKDVIMRLDVQGAERMRELFPEVILIFLIPEKKETWLKQLEERRMHDPDSYLIRIEKCIEELSHIDKFDYLVVNKYGKLEETVDQIEHIIEAEHNRKPHREYSL